MGRTVRSPPRKGWLPSVTFRPGTVVITGAGPGDLGHVSLLAFAYLRKADVIIYDRLTDHSIFQHARKGTELIYAGKGPRRKVQQARINLLLRDQARKGKRVLRWKGGDPYIYGRGYDERQFLEETGIPVRCLPGISSVTGLPTIAGIPVLHRGTASTFGVFTGELGKENTSDGISLQRIALACDTLIGVMVVKKLGLIVKELRKVRRADEPVALIVAGATPRQKVLRTTLAKLPELARRQKVTSPALLIVGKVAALP